MTIPAFEKCREYSFRNEFSQSASISTRLLLIQEQYLCNTDYITSISITQLLKKCIPNAIQYTIPLQYKMEYLRKPPCNTEHNINCNVSVIHDETLSVYNTKCDISTKPGCNTSIIYDVNTFVIHAVIHV